MRKSLLRILIGTFLGSLVVLGTFTIYNTHFTQEAQDQKLREIYKQLIANTGQSQNALPLIISEELVDNAYNDGKKIVIFRGLINNTESWDEVALILGHEIAHGMLGHLSNWPENINANEIAVLEANADKMGAVYMMKAGYDVCKGRNVFKRWKEESGNALGQSHPEYSYRFDELNINCGE
jgi:predicted Zn-dependent protease